MVFILYKLLAFDLDHTLCDPDFPIDQDTLQFLQETEASGMRIAIMSGRPAMYINGLGRQLGLKELIVSGENGAYTYYHISFPPNKIIHTTQSEENEAFAQLRQLVQEKFGHHIWIQPNFTNFAVFPMNLDVRDELLNFVKDYYEHTINDPEYTFYIHPDNSFEIVPPGIDKGIALNAIMKEEGITRDQVIAVGNSGNDLPMLRAAGVAIGIGLTEDTDYTFDHIQEAIPFIQKLLNNEA